MAEQTVSMEIQRGFKDRGKEGLYTGRRKTAVARVRIKPGTGKFIVNKKEMEKYFSRKDLHYEVKKPLQLLGVEGQFDVFSTVKGGGLRGQAEAIVLGLARALSINLPERHKELRKAGFLTRDPRMVERKKYGFHKARRATQFSKR